jgi:hypothetical protein
MHLLESRLENFFSHSGYSNISLREPLWYVLLSLPNHFVMKYPWNECNVSATNERCHECRVMAFSWHHNKTITYMIIPWNVISWVEWPMK